MPTTPILSLPYPQGGDTADVPRDVGALAMALDPLGHVPVGAAMVWMAANAPAGWLLMQGQLVSAATYPGLAALFGQVGGNVTIPDMRDRFPVGAGATMALGSNGGAATVLLTANQSGKRSHSHGGATGARDRSQAHGHTGVWRSSAANAPYPTEATIQAGAPLGVSVNYASDTTDPPDHLHAISAEPAADAVDAHENRPPYRGVNFIIRAG